MSTPLSASEMQCVDRPLSEDEQDLIGLAMSSPPPIWMQQIASIATRQQPYKQGQVGRPLGTAMAKATYQRNKKTVKDAIAEAGWLTERQVKEVTGLGKATIYKILRELRDDGEIFRQEQKPHRAGGLWMITR